MLFKTILLIAFVAIGAAAQSAESNAAPEPYSYGYETDTHSAAEQRDPAGRVTGYYTLADTDGRQRRVDYVADEAGFRAKVQTNEVGTKSENPADVEVQASPPNREQFVYQQAPAVQQAPRVVNQQVAAPQAARYQYVQQPSGYGYGYYPSNAYQYGSSYYNQPSYSYPTGYGAYGTGAYGGYGNVNGLYSNGAYGNGAYSSYNSQPAQYYRSVGAPAGVVQGNTVQGRYAVQGVPVNGNYRSGYQTVGVPATQGVSYQTVGVPATQGVSYQTVGVQPAQQRSSSYQGSSNYIVLQKRDAEKVAEEQKKA